MKWARDYKRTDECEKKAKYNFWKLTINFRNKISLTLKIST